MFQNRFRSNASCRCGLARFPHSACGDVYKRQLYDCPVANVVDIVRFKEGDSVTLTVSGDNGDVATVSAVSQANDAGSSNASA